MVLGTLSAKILVPMGTVLFGVVPKCGTAMSARRHEKTLYTQPKTLETNKRRISRHLKSGSVNRLNTVYHEVK